MLSSLRFVRSFVTFRSLREKKTTGLCLIPLTSFVMEGIKMRVFRLCQAKSENYNKLYPKHVYSAHFKYINFSGLLTLNVCSTDCHICGTISAVECRQRKT